MFVFCLVLPELPVQEGFRMVVRAGRDIRKGEDITHSYVDAQVTLSKKSQYLRE